MRAISLFFIVLLCSPILHALEASQGKAWLEDLYKLRVNTYYSINAFYNYSVNLGDKEHYLSIQDSTDQIGQLNDALLSSGIDGALDGAFSAVADQVDQYIDLLNENVDILESDGYSDLAMAGDLAVVHTELNSALSDIYQSVKTATPYDLPKFTELTHQSSLTIALMMTKYSARSTSGTSQVYVGSDKELTLDVLADTFNQQLSDLMSQSQADQNTNESLRAAETKWEFIEKSYVNYNQARVNFIVNLYSKKIIQNLELAGQNS